MDGIAYLDVEEFVDKLAPPSLDGWAGFVLGGVFAFCLRRLYRVAVPSLGFPQPLAHRLEFLAHDGTDGVLNDVVHDVIRRVIRAGRLALTLVVLKIYIALSNDSFLALRAFAFALVEILEGNVNVTPLLFDDRLFLFCYPEPEFEKALVNRAELADAERLEVDRNELMSLEVFVTRQQSEGLRKVDIR